MKPRPENRRSAPQQPAWLPCILLLNGSAWRHPSETFTASAAQAAWMPGAKSPQDSENHLLLGTASLSGLSKDLSDN